MAKRFVALSFLLLVHGCLARDYMEENKCRIQSIDALEPIERVEAEGGFTEFFNSDEQQLQCSGVQVIRHQIQPRGLFLPSYTSAPILFYVEQGSGFQGVMIAGCPETYEMSQEQEQFEGGRGGRSVVADRHQKLHRFRQGDMVAIPVGAAHWLYNDGEEELVIIALLDAKNYANQIDARRFFLAGNSQQQQQQGEPRSWGRRQQGQSQTKGSNNVFQGIEVDTLAKAFNIDQETARMLQGEDDHRGHIVMVERGLQVIHPSVRHEGQEYSGRPQANGLEETICSMKLRESIDDPSKADVYNPQVGRCTRLNSFKFPILQYLQLSAERGVLHRYGIVSPNWIMNAHNIIYVTEGTMRMQIVNDQGQEVFNDQIQERQLVVVPQNFAVVKQAGEQGCKWISFRTNDNAIMNTMAGKNSVMRALPLDVIAYSYRMSREDAQRLKYSRREAVLIPYGARTSDRRSSRGGSMEG